MALPKVSSSRQHDSFEENAADGGVDRRVNIKNSSSNPIPTQDIYAGKYFDATYPNATTEVFTWYDDISKAALFATITIVYTDSTKRDLLSYDEVLA